VKRGKERAHSQQEKWSENETRAETPEEYGVRICPNEAGQMMSYSSDSEEHGAKTADIEMSFGRPQ
jgi:hypothetical protein